MSSDETRWRYAAELKQSDKARDAEADRKASLTMWERINEAEGVSADLKNILHTFATHIGLE